MASLNDKINEAFTDAAGGTKPHDEIITVLSAAIDDWEDGKETPLIPRFRLQCRLGRTGDEECKKHVFLVKFERATRVVASFRRCNGGIQVKDAEGDSVWRDFVENMVVTPPVSPHRGGRRRKSKRSSTKSKKNVRRRTTRH
jgi:hypothetical protein